MSLAAKLIALVAGLAFRKSNTRLRGLEIIPSTPLSPQRVSKSYNIGQRQLLATISIGIRVKVNRFDARPV